MRKIEEVLRLHFECGRNNREISQSVQASPTTVGDYLHRAKLAGIGWPLPAGMTERELEARLFPTLLSSKVKLCLGLMETESSCHLPLDASQALR